MRVSADFFDFALETVDEIERTSAARAAASPGVCDCDGACGFLPIERPPCGGLILGGGAAARALVGCGGALAGAAPSVLPSPWKFLLLLVLPKQFPISGDFLSGNNAVEGNAWAIVLPYRLDLPSCPAVRRWP